MEAVPLPDRPIEYCTRCAETCARKPKVKLAGAKTTLFNPYLVSFKKAALDTTLGKLSDEHCRTTLPYAVGTLATEKYFNYDPSSCFIPKFGMMNLGEIEKTEQEEKFAEDVRKTLEDSYQKTHGAFMMPIGRVIQIPTVKHISYLNFRVRLVTPEPLQKWREFVHEKDLQHPYGGLEFMRKKFKSFEDMDVNMIGHKGAEPHIIKQEKDDPFLDAGLKGGVEMDELQPEIPQRDHQLREVRDGNLREFKPSENTGLF